jgi:hypothetical protein
VICVRPLIFHSNLRSFSLENEFRKKKESPHFETLSSRVVKCLWGWGMLDRWSTRERKSTGDRQVGGQVDNYIARNPD